MPLNKYFKTEQKLILKPQPTDTGQNLVQLTTYLVDVRANNCDLRLPYGKSIDEQFPFEDGMSVELMGDALGMGIKVTGTFERYLDSNTIRIQLTPDLEMFQRRLHPRQDLTLGLRYTKGRGTLRSYRNQWQKNVELLERSVDLSKLGNFPRNQVNLSLTGIRFPVKPPVAESDLCLLLIELDADTPPVCTLAEVVWVGEQEGSNTLVAGMQFINIRKSDQQRILEFLKRQH